MSADAVAGPRCDAANVRRHAAVRSAPRPAAPAAPAAVSILDEAEALRRLHSTMLAMAATWFHLRPHDAEDVVQSAFETFLEVRTRFTAADEHAAILVGILRNKCHEHLRRKSGEQRRLRTYRASADAARENPWIRPGSAGEAPSVLDELQRREQNHEIRGALDRLSPGAGQLVSLIVGRELRRPDLIAHFGVNANTLDSRLRSCRCELRRLLSQAGIAS